MVTLNLKPIESFNRGSTENRDLVRKLQIKDTSNVTDFSVPFQTLVKLVDAESITNENTEFLIYHWKLITQHKNRISNILLPKFKIKYLKLCLDEQIFPILHLNLNFVITAIIVTNKTTLVETVHEINEKTVKEIATFFIDRKRL